MRNKILTLIYNSIDELNAQNDPNNQLTKIEQTVIFGKDSNIDSLGLVNLIVSLEQAINDELGSEISLADERAMSQESSPFKTVATLADYVLNLIEAEEKGNE